MTNDNLQEHIDRFDAINSSAFGSGLGITFLGPLLAFLIKNPEPAFTKLAALTLAYSGASASSYGYLAGFHANHLREIKQNGGDAIILTFRQIGISGGYNMYTIASQN